MRRAYGFAEYPIGIPTPLAHIMAPMERDVFESDKRAVVYLDLLGFAALVEGNPRFFAVELPFRPNSEGSQTDIAAGRLALFHQVLESNIATEQPNHAMLFSDCAFGVFYTPKACAGFAINLMHDFLRVKVPVRMGLGFGTFCAMSTSSAVTNRSTVVRAMFGGTSIVRAVAAESCGGKGMRIFAHSSFSDLLGANEGEHGQKFVSIPEQVKSVSCELDYASRTNRATVGEWVERIWEMAHSAPAEVQNHYSETLAALSRMKGYDVNKFDEERRY